MSGPSEHDGPAGRAGGSLADLVAAPAGPGFGESFPLASMAKIAVLAGLLVWMHVAQLHWLGKKWISDSNWTHGFVIPLFSLYLVYTRRDDLFAARRKTNYLGLALMLLFLVGEVVALVLVRSYWPYQLCMVGLVFSLVLYLGGGSVIRVAWLPILYLIFALPIPTRLYTAISLPLQEFAAKGAAAILRLLQVRIESTASALRVFTRSGQWRDLTVAEACSGMKLLMAFMALGVAMAYLDYKPLWQRIILVIAGVPIAIFCNVIRVTITCWMFYIDKQELGRDFMHTITGVIMLIPAFGMLWLLAWLLRVLFVEVEEDDAPPDQAVGEEAGA